MIKVVEFLKFIDDKVLLTNKQTYDYMSNTNRNTILKSYSSFLYLSGAY